MLNPMIVQLQMRKAQAEKEKLEIVLKIKRVINELATQYINPFFKNANDLKAEEIEQCGDELLKYKAELKNLENEISDLKNQLGV